MSKIKIGVFGGGRGSVAVNQLLHSDDAELVAVCDRYQPLLDDVDKKAKEAGIEVALYTDFEDFIKHDMDAVVLANYATEHATYAIRCLNAGMHVLSEVLPAETLAQAVELIETVERTGLVYCYAENYCYMKPTFEMRRRYAAGEIGEVQYGEGEDIHDCSAIWPSLTYGDRNHWRNVTHSTFYCTHSIGPLITITGLRPIRVVGFETPPTLSPKQLEVASLKGSGVEMIVLENGAVLKSVHGNLKREPGSVNYQIYGSEGMMESARYNKGEFNIYKEGDKLCEGSWESYSPEIEIEKDKASGVQTHGGSDFYTIYFFVQKILGREDGKWGIDVYTAMDMWLPGMFAWRSAMNGNCPMDIPNFRIKEERDKYRYDNATTNPEIAGKDVQPTSTFANFPRLSDEAYAHVRDLWLAEEATKHNK